LRQPGSAVGAAGQVRLQPRRGDPRLLAVQACGQCLAYLLAVHAGLSPPGRLLVPTRGPVGRFSRPGTAPPAVPVAALPTGGRRGRRAGPPAPAGAPGSRYGCVAGPAGWTRPAGRV